MEKQAKPAPDAAVRCARASLLLASLRRGPRFPPPSRDLQRSSGPSSAIAGRALRDANKGPLRRGDDLAAARREAAVHARLAGFELLLVLAVAPVVLLLLFLLGLL